MTTARELAGRVRDAAADGTRLRLRGHGRWMTANRPVVADAELSLADCSGIVEYVPGDFTLTARAGTSLGEIAAAAREHGQWLPVDPPGDDRGSVGATVATASCGPHAAAFGTVRDQLLGIEFVTGSGDVVRAGGRVVKNVAGFDLTRLMAGAWGTLGVVTEITVRLRALPTRDETLAVAIDDDAPAFDRLSTTVRGFATAPLACELVDGALASRLGLPERPMLLLHLGGNADSMRAQRDAIARLGSATPVDGAVWRALRTLDAADDAVWRVSRGPARFAATWREARTATAAFPARTLQGSPLRGVVRCAVPSEPSGSGTVALRRALEHPPDTTLVAETLPGPLWNAIPCAVDDRLSRGLRGAFDPAGILNPGILGTA